MANRASRRAAERQTQKLAANASKPLVATASVGGSNPPPETFHFQGLVDEIKQTSEARINANRANAQHSTGPVSSAGKAISSMNAVKTGLTGRTVLLPSDDAVAYQQHLDRHFSEFAPVTDKEKALVQTIADTEWRLLRIAPLEAGLYAIGRRKIAHQFVEETDEANREALIMAEVFDLYFKQLSNLALQERRLRSHRKADIAELRQLQQERADKEKAEFTRAADIYKRCNKLKRDFCPADHGFDFSLDEFIHYWEQNNAQYPLTETYLDFATVLAAYRAAQKEQKAA